MQLIESDKYETVFNFTAENLPDGMLVHLWLKLQTESHPSLFQTFLFADIWPNPKILCVVNQHRNGSKIIIPWCDPKHGKNLVKFLRELSLETKMTNSEYLFCIVPEYHKGSIETFIGDEFKIEISYDYQFWIPPEKRKILLQKEIQPPEGYYFDELKINEKNFVADTWSQQFSGSLERVENWIKYMPNVALRVEGTDELASFELLNDEHGMMTHLYTVKEHRMKGLATKVEEKLAQMLIHRNILPFKNVEKINKTAKNITDKSPWWEELDHLMAYLYIYTK